MRSLWLVSLVPGLCLAQQSQSPPPPDTTRPAAVKADTTKPDTTKAGPTVIQTVVPSVSLPMNAANSVASATAGAAATVVPPAANRRAATGRRLGEQGRGG